MRNKEEVAQELKTAGIGCMFCEVFWLRNVGLFAENLRDAEHILGGVWCLFRKHWGRLVATNTRILFLERKVIWGSVVESIHYSKVNSVEMTKGLVFSEMTITFGMATQQVQWVPKFQLTPFIELLQDKLEDCDFGRQPAARDELPQEAAASDMEPDVVTQLERLNLLRLKGMLNDDEFEEQQIRLLSD